MVCPVCQLETWPEHQSHTNPIYCVDALKHEVETLRRLLAQARNKQKKPRNLRCPSLCQCPCHDERN